MNTFKADRFLTVGMKATVKTPATLTPSHTPTDPPATIGPARSAISSFVHLEPHFSLKGHSGAWISFGGDTHQCPGRHWVKKQMILSFAVINDAFEIELLTQGVA